MSEIETIVSSLEEYVGKILHTRLDAERRSMAGLPSFMELIYASFDGRILGRQCVLLVAKAEIGTPAEIAKHIDLVSESADAIGILVAPAMNSDRRDRLIGQGTPFIVPGNQFYVPELGMDLRERFRNARARNRDGLSPTAQAVLFHHLLRLGPGETTPRLLSDRLNCTNMTIGRAFDNLVDMKLVTTEKRGRERHIVFNIDRRELFETAIPHLRSPVRKTRYIRGDSASLKQYTGQVCLQLAGESALAELSNLSAPPVVAYAIAYDGWKTASKTEGFTETEPSLADFILETWHYDPETLSNSHVDPLSLYAQFHGHGDPRVESAAEELLERIEW